MSLITLPSGMTVEKLEAFWREAAAATYASGTDPNENEDGSSSHCYGDAGSNLWYEESHYLCRIKW